MSVYPSAGQTMILVFYIPQALQRKRITYMSLVRNCTGKRLLGRHAQVEKKYGRRLMYNAKA